MPTPIYRRLYERVTLYDEAGVAVEAYHALVAGSPSGDPVLIEPQLEARGDGQEREVGRRSAFEVATAERHVIQQLRAWIASRTAVRAVAVGAGMLAQWDEEVVPVEVDRATGPLSLDGPAFRLASVLRRAAVYRDTDLLAPLRAGGAAWAGSIDRTLPVPSSPYARPLRVWAHSEDGDEVTVTAYSFADVQLGQAVSGAANEDGSTTAALALPVGTWYVTVETDGASWPSLYTREPAPVEVVVPSGGGGGGGGDCEPPPAPENLAGTPGAAEVLWTWDPVPGADGYVLEWGEADDGPYPLSVYLALADLADPDNPAYSTEAEVAVRLYAVVRAYVEVDGGLLVSDPSAEADAVLAVPSPPPDCHFLWLSPDETGGFADGQTVTSVANQSTDNPTYTLNFQAGAGVPGTDPSTWDAASPHFNGHPCIVAQAGNAQAVLGVGGAAQEALLFRSAGSYTAYVLRQTGVGPNESTMWFHGPTGTGYQIISFEHTGFIHWFKTSWNFGLGTHPLIDLEAHLVEFLSKGNGHLYIYVDGVQVAVLMNFDFEAASSNSTRLQQTNNDNEQGDVDVAALVAVRDIAYSSAVYDPMIANTRAYVEATFGIPIA